MKLFEKWAERRAKADANRRSLAINNDETLIAQHAPEVVGMGFVKGAAFVLEELRRFRANCSPNQAQELARRIGESQLSWEDQGLTMPYWGNLVVLRRFQEELREP